PKSASKKDAPAAEKPRRGVFQRLGDWYQRNRLRLTMLTLTLLFLIAYLAESIFIPILPGQRGVVWSRFFGGTLLNYSMKEGLRLKFPWDKYYIYDTRLNEETEELNVLSEDALTLDVEVTVRYRLIPDKTPTLHQIVGPDFVRVLLMPEVAAHTRREMAQHEPNELFSDRREEIEDRILQSMREEIRVQSEGGGIFTDLIHIEDLFLRSIKLPKEVDAAIKSKLAQRQLMLEFDYRIQREEKEAKRKSIEAKGIKDFQDVISEGISPELLRWKGIEATLALAQSSNSKVVVIGSGEDGLPIILGNVDSPRPLIDASAAAGSEDGDRPSGTGAGSIVGPPGSGPSSPPPDAAGSSPGVGSITGSPGSGPSSPPPGDRR
ncbi:MAG: prohibitin family protein, partial [Acidobacteriota bacterium]